MRRFLRSRHPWLVVVVSSAAACSPGEFSPVEVPDDIPDAASVDVALDRPVDRDVVGAQADAAPPIDRVEADVVTTAEAAVDVPPVPACSNRMGRFCGWRIGLDPNVVYDCNDDLDTVAHRCAARCLMNGDGQDVCPCPSGDGLYCGASLGVDAQTLYDCRAGVASPVARCERSCHSEPAGVADRCDACSSGDGLYCGAALGADPNVIYRCTAGRLAEVQRCGGRCRVNPPGTADDCGQCPSGDGAYCGGPVGLDPNTLFHCAGGTFAVQQRCASTCHVSPPGTADYCLGAAGSGSLLCRYVQWWDVRLTYGPYMLGGWWDTDIAVSSGSPVQLRHASRLDRENVYAWGWMPEFTDTVTGARFRFLHLRPSARYLRGVGTVYAAGTIVGLSGGDTADTGLGPYSTGAHLCVQTLLGWRTAFPAGRDACM